MTCFVGDVEGSCWLLPLLSGFADDDAIIALEMRRLTKLTLTQTYLVSIIEETTMFSYRL